MTPQLLVTIVACLAMLETPNGIPTHPGPHGETGRWQLTPAVRHDRSVELRKLVRAARITDEAIAMRHVVWIREQLIAHGLTEPTPFDIGIAWNAGVTAKIDGTAIAQAYNFGARLQALVDDAQKK